MGKGDHNTEPRSVAVAIPFTFSRYPPKSKLDVEVCLVTSRKHEGKYVLPKGGVEAGESTQQAAEREMWEEAGLRPSENQPQISQRGLLSVLDHKPYKGSLVKDPNDPSFVPRAIYTAHGIFIDREGTRPSVVGHGFGSEPGESHYWPEQAERERRWFALEEASEEISWRRDIAELLRLWEESIQL
ncbi:NUDIX hydrolase [Violaceomyces palustris]|uniref:NUDIX hydrolase n=1 Tax=Violaceomyces palustris TaxID=1673888 RepID=A0ACD0NY45_9BASI|nr:NUDIX hydrolase [Violaceomyces palustris]